jgi:hypothetical protein
MSTKHAIALRRAMGVKMVLVNKTSKGSWGNPNMAMVFYQDLVED